jgi:hypothetical protein
MVIISIAQVSPCSPALYTFPNHSNVLVNKESLKEQTLIVDNTISSAQLSRVDSRNIHDTSHALFLLATHCHSLQGGQHRRLVTEGLKHRWVKLNSVLKHLGRQQCVGAKALWPDALEH